MRKKLLIIVNILLLTSLMAETTVKDFGKVGTILGFDTYLYAKTEHPTSNYHVNGSNVYYKNLGNGFITTADSNEISPFIRPQKKEAFGFILQEQKSRSVIYGYFLSMPLYRLEWYWEDVESTSRYLNVYEDNNAPEVGAIETLENHQDNLDHGNWIQATTINIGLESLSDLSGLDIYYWQVGSSAENYTNYTNNVDNLTLNEGRHFIQFYAKDNVGNDANYNTKTVFIDGTSPSSIQPSFYGYELDHNNDIKVIFNWPQSSDNKPGVNFVSGVSDDTGYLTTSSGFAITGRTACKVVTPGNTTFNVKAVDNAGNHSTVLSTSINVPYQLKINSLHNTEVLNQEGNFYRTKLLFNLTKPQAIYNRDETDVTYTLSRTIDGNTINIGLTSEDLIISPDNNEVYYYDLLTVPTNAHKNIEYKITTNYSNTVSKDDQIVSVEAKNIRSFTTANLFVNENNYTGYWTNILPQIQLSDNISNITSDLDGDSVIYRLRYLSEDKEVSLLANNSLQPIENTPGNTASGIHRFYLESIDSYTNSQSVKINNPYPIPNENNEIEPIHIKEIKYDAIKPIISNFEILGKTINDTVGVTPLSTTTVTNNNTVSLNIHLNDTGGSGLKKLDIYDKNLNGTPNSYTLKETYFFKYDNELLSVYDNEKLTGSPVISSVAKDAISGAYNLNFPNWSLYSGLTDTTTSTRLVVFDNAGNDSILWNNQVATYTQKTVTVDNTPPNLTITSSPITHNNDDKFIEFIITSEPRSQVYRILPNGTEQLVSGSSIKLVANNYNSPIRINLKSYEASGNNSGIVTHVGYSKSSYGTINSNNITMGDTINDSLNRWISIPLTYTASQAKINSRKLIRVNNSGVQQGNPISLSANNKFLITDLAPHSTLRFKLQSTNENGDINTSTIMSKNLKNFNPAFSIGTSYPSNKEYLTNGDSITWPHATDSDTDLLKYTLKIYDENNNVIKTKTNLSTTNYSLDSLNLDSRKDYKWNVFVSDFYLGANLQSNIKLLTTPNNFYIDNTPPLISDLILPISGTFTNIDQLDFNVSDIETSTLKNSGINSVDVEINSNDTSITSTSFSNTEESSISFNLPEGVLDLEIIVKDNVELQNQINSILYIDRQSPNITNFEIVAIHDSTNYYIDNSLVSIKFDVSDSFSGPSHFLYAFTDSISDSVSADDWKRKEIKEIVPQTGYQSTLSVEKDLNFNVTDGNAKYLRVKVFDHAGNILLINSDLPIIKDTTPPVVSIPNTDFLSEYGSVKYLKNISSLNTLSISSNVIDNESGIKTSSKIIENNGNVVSTLVDGKEYALFFKAINNALLVNNREIVNFIYDSTSPTNLNINLTPPDSRNFYVKGEAITLDVIVTEPHSPIVYSEITIKDSNNNDVTNTITGNVNSKLLPNTSWTRDTTDSTKQHSSYSFTLPTNFANDVYTINLLCKNSTNGLTNKSTTFTVSNILDVVTLSVPSYSTLDNTINYQWNYIPSDDSISKNVSVESYVIKYKEVNEISWSDTVFTDSTVTFDEASKLQHNSSYIFKIDAKLSNNTVISGNSSVVKIDTTSPDISNEATKTLWPTMSKSNTLYGAWDVYDNESGISFINFKIEKATANGFVKVHQDEWIKVNGYNQIDSFTFGDLGLQTNDKVLITRQIINGAGSFVESTSNQIIIDDTPPEIPIVSNNKPFINPTYAISMESQRPESYWTYSNGDPETGATYYWAFVKNKENIESQTVEWILDDGSKKAKISDEAFFSSDLQDETWYFVVKAVNRLGLESYGFSAGTKFDTTAPIVSEVTVLESTDSSSLIDTFYITSDKGLHLYIQANDNESGVTAYKGDYGNLIDGEYTVLSNTSDIITNSSPLLNISNIDSAYNSLTFRGMVYNGANISETGYTHEIRLDLQSPSVTNIISVNNNGTFSYSWDVVTGNSPIVNYEYMIVKDGNTFVNWTSLNSTVRSLVIETKENPLFTDGNYTISIKAISDSGLCSENDEIGIGSQLVLDATAPILQSPIASEYASRFIELSLNASDNNGSGINEYQYKIGTTLNPGIISDGWVKVDNKSGYVNEIIELNNFNTFITGIPDGEVLYITAMTKDNAGNWSVEKTSNPIIIDKTPGTTESLEIPRYSRFNSKIENISYLVKDEQSGIKLIKFELYKLQGINESLIFSDEIAVNDNIIDENALTLLLNESLLSNAEDYILKISTINGSGDQSIFFPSSDEMTVDTIKPVLNFNNYLSEIVVNTSSDNNKFSIPYTLSEIGDVHFILEKVNGETETFDILNHTQGVGSYGFHHGFNNEKLAYGNYILTAVVYDRAGNENYIESNTLPNVQNIRYNRPPIITISQIYTNPGRPITLSVNDGLQNGDHNYIASVEDLDGDFSDEEPFTYEWTFFNGNSPTNSTQQTLNGNNTSIAFYQSSNEARRTAYPFELKVTDNKGQSATINYSGNSTEVPENLEPLMFIVKNTWKGDLFVDEFWRSTPDDNHFIRGDINVGFDENANEITLTVVEGTVVEIKSSTDNDQITFDHGLYIDGSLIVENGTIFQMEDLNDNFWKGISINDNAQATFTRTTIMDAKRAIAIKNNAVVTIEESIFRSNIIGLHLFNSNPTITNSIIRDNIAYGIKEDLNCSPVLSGNTYTNNTIDYYDSINTFESGDNN